MPFGTQSTTFEYSSMRHREKEEVWQAAASLRNWYIIALCTVMGFNKACSMPIDLIVKHNATTSQW